MQKNKKKENTFLLYAVHPFIVLPLASIPTSPAMQDRYGFDSSKAIHQLENPALISFPLQ